MTKYIPITQDFFPNKNWTRHASIGFAKEDTVAPLYVNELSDAIESMPIAFIKQDDKFILVVLMGIKPGENLFISNNEQWLSRYMPVIYRSSPFNLLQQEKDSENLVFCIDEACIIENGNGEPFFKESGEISENLNKAFNFVKEINSSRALTEAICNSLSHHNLIVPWPVTFNDGGSEINVTGIYQIDEKALNALSDKEFIDLRASHALPLAYAQLLSMRKISLLSELQKTKAKERRDKSTENETFNFGGLV